MAEPTPTIGWRKRDEDGMIVVWDLGPPRGEEVAPMLDATQWTGVRAVEERWGELCREIGSRHQLPDGWLQAMIWRESGGNPRAYRVERDKNGQAIMVNGRALTGVGLLQITSPALKRNRTDTELFDPGINIELGARYISELASRLDCKGADGRPDFARIAASFNAGSVRPSTANRFGMHSTGSHIDQEVRALNVWIYQKLEGEKFFAAQALAKQFSTAELLGEDFDRPAGLDDEPPPTDRNT
jgi:hypothetical protein